MPDATKPRGERRWRSDIGASPGVRAGGRVRQSPRFFQTVSTRRRPPRDVMLSQTRADAHLTWESHMVKFRLAAVVILAVIGLGVSAADKPNPARTTVDESVGTIEKRDLLRVSVNDLQGPGAITHKETRVDEQGNA